MKPKPVCSLREHTGFFHDAPEKPGNNTLPGNPPKKNKKHLAFLTACAI